MVSCRATRVRPLAFLGLSLATALFLAAVPARAGGPLPGVPSGWPPWQTPGWKGYIEPTRPIQPPPVVKAAPSKYTLVIAVVPQKNPEDYADKIVLMAHVPEEAKVWIDDEPTKSIGMERYYVSPPLEQGKDYRYLIRVDWPEDGQWVSKTSTVMVRAGEMHCFFVEPSASLAEKIQANLDKLGPEDRKLAEKQKYCAVEDSLLGTMGAPVKVMVKDQPVFLCCAGCKEKALAEPDKTLGRVKELQAKNTAPSEK